MRTTTAQRLSVVAGACLLGVGSSVFHPESSRVARMAAGGRHGLAQSLFQVGGIGGAPARRDGRRAFGADRPGNEGGTSSHGREAQMRAVLPLDERGRHYPYAPIGGARCSPPPERGLPLS